MSDLARILILTAIDDLICINQFLFCYKFLAKDICSWCCACWILRRPRAKSNTLLFYAVDHKYFWCYCRKKFLIEFKVAFAENDSLNSPAHPDSTAPKVIIVDVVQSVQHSLRNGLFLALIKITSGYATVNLSICHVQVKKNAIIWRGNSANKLLTVAKCVGGENFCTKYESLISAVPLFCETNNKQGIKNKTTHYTKRFVSSLMQNQITDKEWKMDDRPKCGWKNTRFLRKTKGKLKSIEQVDLEQVY